MSPNGLEAKPAELGYDINTPSLSVLLAYSHGWRGSVSLKPLYRYSTLLTRVLFVFFIDLVSFASAFSGNFQNFLLSCYGILRRAVGEADVLSSSS